MLKGSGLPVTEMFKRSPGDYLDRVRLDLTTTKTLSDNQFYNFKKVMYHSASFYEY